MSRPRVLDETKQREVCALVTAGMSLARAAEYVGCSVKTIRREREQDEEFDLQVRRAKTAARLGPLQAVRRAAATHWRAAAWLVERQDRQDAKAREARRERVELQRVVGKVKEVVRREVPDELRQWAIERQIDQVAAGKEPSSLFSDCPSIDGRDFDEPLSETRAPETMPTDAEIDSAIAYLDPIYGKRRRQRETKDRFIEAGLAIAGGGDEQAALDRVGLNRDSPAVAEMVRITREFAVKHGRREPTTPIEEEGRAEVEEHVNAAPEQGTKPAASSPPENEKEPAVAASNETGEAPGGEGFVPFAHVFGQNEADKTAAGAAQSAAQREMRRSG